MIQNPINLLNENNEASPTIPVDISYKEIKPNSTKDKIVQIRKAKQQKKIKRLRNKKDYNELSIGDMINHMNYSYMAPSDIPNMANLARDTLPKEYLNSKCQIDVFNLFKNKTVATWDDVDEIYKTCLQCLLDLGEKVSYFAKGVNQMGKNYFDDFVGFSKSLSILSKDMDHISNQIVAIEEPIKDKQGIIVSADELMACYAKYQEFLKLNETINTIMVPTLCDLSDAFQTAYDRFMADQTPEDKELAEKELNTELETINKEGA